MSLHDPDKYINRLKDKHPNLYANNLDQHPVTLAFNLINADYARNGTPWNKCLDCGQPYVIGEGDSNSTFCSEKCERLTREYLGL